MSRIWIVIAAYYEEGSIGEIVTELREAGYEDIVVVDDGSEDNTFYEADEAGATVLRHVVNRGQGAALRTGMEYALRNGASYLMHFDADGQHRVDEIPDMLEPVKGGIADIALGTRFEKTTDISYLKKAVLKAGIVFQWFVSGIWLSDAHNGFRAMNRDAAEKLLIKQDRMGHATEIVDLIRRHHLVHTEVPVTIEYSEYAKNKGQSILNSVNIAAKNMFHKLLR